MGKRKIIVSIILWGFATLVFLFSYNIKTSNSKKALSKTIEKTSNSIQSDIVKNNLTDEQKTGEAIDESYVDNEISDLTDTETPVLENSKAPIHDILPKEIIESIKTNNKRVDEKDLVYYTGDIEHIFFHPLVAFPERAFDGDAGSQGMENYMATALECKRLLEEAYENNYVLVDINKVYNKTLQNNGSYKMERSSFLFPKNKKPLIISMDDVNYYKYMIQDGCNYKLILDDNGNIATYAEDLNGKPVVSYDTEVITIVEEFLKVHPDFSFDGARGVIGLTGYNGILGYRTQSKSPNRQEEIENVKPVIKELKELGWTFASHSYGHYHMARILNQQFKNDVDDWKEEVESLVGPTRVFLYPYGEYIKHDDAGMEKINYLINVGGFDIHCGVSVIPFEKSYSNYVFVDRKNIDGLTLRNQKRRVEHIFNADYVIDREARGK